MYIPEPFVFLFGVAFTILMLLTRAFYRERNEAREIAEGLQQKLKERPIQRIVYSDDVIESKIVDWCENQELYGVARNIENKLYLK